MEKLSRKCMALVLTLAMIISVFGTVGVNCITVNAEDEPRAVIVIASALWQQDEEGNWDYAPMPVTSVEEYKKERDIYIHSHNHVTLGLLLKSGSISPVRDEGGTAFKNITVTDMEGNEVGSDVVEITSGSVPIPESERYTQSYVYDICVNKIGDYKLNFEIKAPNPEDPPRIPLSSVVLHAKLPEVGLYNNNIATESSLCSGDETFYNEFRNNFFILPTGEERDDYKKTVTITKVKGSSTEIKVDLDEHVIGNSAKISISDEEDDDISLDVSYDISETFYTQNEGGEWVQDGETQTRSEKKTFTLKSGNVKPHSEEAEADIKAATDVMNLIKALPAPEEIGVYEKDRYDTAQKDLDDIMNAREAYDGLTPSQQEYVENISKLEYDELEIESFIRGDVNILNQVLRISELQLQQELENIEDLKDTMSEETLERYNAISFKNIDNCMETLGKITDEYPIGNVVVLLKVSDELLNELIAEIDEVIEMAWDDYAAAVEAEEDLDDAKQMATIKFMEYYAELDMDDYREEDTDSFDKIMFDALDAIEAAESKDQVLDALRDAYKAIEKVPTKAQHEAQEAAEQAKKDAEAAKKEAEDAKKDAETARKEAEAAKNIPVDNPKAGDVIYDAASKSFFTVKKASDGKSAGEVEFSGVLKKTKTVNIPETVTHNKVSYDVTAIGAGALEGNTKVTTVIIPSKVVSIGAKAFFGCTKLKKQTVKSLGLKKVGKKAYTKVPKKCKTKLPKSKKKAYKKLFKKGGYKGKIK